MSFEFNKANQLEIHSAFCVSGNGCPKCFNPEFSSLFMEKCASKVPLSYSISLDSVGPNMIFYMRCDCGHTWLEPVTPNHKRPRIKGVWMRNFQKKT